MHHRRLRAARSSSASSLSREQVSRLREGRHPAPVLEPRVPADMVDVQVGAHDEVDVLDREPVPPRAAHVGVDRLHVPVRPRRRGLVVADAAIDQDGMVRRAHHVGLDAEHELPGRPVERAPAPARRGSPPALRRQTRQEIEHRQKRALLLDDPMDRDLAEAEGGRHLGFRSTHQDGPDIRLTPVRTPRCPRARRLPIRPRRARRRRCAAPARSRLASGA